MTDDPNRTARATDILLISGGIVAVCGAVLATFFAAGIDGMPDDVLFEFEGGIKVGQTDRLIARLATTVVGIIGVFCVVRGWRGIQSR